jgi:hypothetical protein
VEALVDAADEDRGTGGFDTQRRIYPSCKLITASGVEEVAESELLATYQRVSARERAA